MGHLARRSHLTKAQLVKDLARFLFGEEIHLLALVASQEAERSEGKIWLECERLEARDERIAAEGHGVPGDSRRRDRPCRREVDQRPQVERAAQEQVVDPCVGRGDVRGATEEGGIAIPQPLDGIVERRAAARLDELAVLVGIAVSRTNRSWAPARLRSAASG
jgi:hypothetical protein